MTRRSLTDFHRRLLGILTANKAKATFFEIGNKVAANPASAKRVVDAGMELGNHTWEHPNMTTLPPSDVPGQLTSQRRDRRRRRRCPTFRLAMCPARIRADRTMAARPSPN